MHNEYMIQAVLQYYYSLNLSTGKDPKQQKVYLKSISFVNSFFQSVDCGNLWSMQTTPLKKDKRKKGNIQNYFDQVR